MDTSSVARGDAAVEGELISLLFGSFALAKMMMMMMMEMVEESLVWVVPEGVEDLGRI